MRAVGAGQHRDRGVAIAAQRREQRAFGHHLRPALGVVDRTDPFARLRIVGAAFDRNGALRGRGKPVAYIERMTDARLAQPFQSGRGFVWCLPLRQGEQTGRRRRTRLIAGGLAEIGTGNRKGREAWARGELLAALRIIQAGDIDPAHMIGSWAGAMGQTQFMPSAFMNFAVDGDGDGRRDIWGSMPDVIASTANYLARSGWQPGQAWGAEVQLPQGFDLARADPSVRQSGAQWEAEGIRSIDGRPLPALTDATVFLPAGARGPVFLLGPNFRTILRYNNSTSYALSVAYLGQRILGGQGVQAAWPTSEPPLTLAEREEIQTRLAAQGYDVGKVDGVLGLKTRKAARLFQAKIAVPQDGYANKALLLALRAQPSV